MRPLIWTSCGIVEDQCCWSGCSCCCLADSPASVAGFWHKPSCTMDCFQLLFLPDQRPWWEFQQYSRHHMLFPCASTACTNKPCTTSPTSEGQYESRSTRVALCGSNHITVLYATHLQHNLLWPCKIDGMVAATVSCMQYYKLPCEPWPKQTNGHACCLLDVCHWLST